ncbi:MAG: BlaI/MecI/CopY family transcriptional regulator [Planctomycetota bacterium]|nr:BlaI/MecI/CopY family transcriptional regulator [Planctomycetota bacterium]MDA1214559.1 BlaI/MecI/CopY family transcriptional regulator [Planctomycetota bacterium]
MKEFHLTKCEREVMDVVWKLGSATVQEVVDALPRDLAYTTVMTTLKILTEKRKAVTKRKVGRAFVYEAAVAREDVQKSMASELTKSLFDGSIKSLVLSLIDENSMTQSDIDELRDAIAAVEEKK